MIEVPIAEVQTGDLLDLRPGERVVLSPQGLRDGQRVNPKSAQP